MREPSPSRLELGSEFRAHIADGSIETLDGWAERVLTATSIDEVFGEG